LFGQGHPQKKDIRKGGTSGTVTLGRLKKKKTFGGGLRGSLQAADWFRKEGFITEGKKKGR